MINVVLTAILSSLLFNASFFLWPYGAWLVFVWWIPLYHAARKTMSLSGKIITGIAWGLTLYAIHFIWLVILLLYKSEASTGVSWLLYGCVVVLFTALSAAWFIVASHALGRARRCKVILFLLLLAGHFVFIENYALRIIQLKIPYPFLSPLIPMTEFVKTIRKPVASFLLEKEGEYKIFHIGSDTDPAYLRSPSVVAMRIYHKLVALKLHEHKKQFKNLIILGPESLFPFPLNESQEALDLWSYVLPSNAHFLFGSQRKAGEKLHQTVYYIQEIRITKSYDKLFRTPINESLPPFYKNKDFFTKIFLNGKRPVNKGKICATLFDLGGSIYITPQICSDLFFNPQPKLPIKTEAILWFVNDSWFIKPMQQWMKTIAHLRASTLGIPIVYVCSSGLVS